jgi:transposase
MEIDPQLLENKENNSKKKKKRTRKKNAKKSKNDELTAIKLRIYPTKEQREIIGSWLGAGRFIYNSCLYYIKQEYIKNKSNVLSQKLLRDKFINNKNYEKENKWMLGIPYDIRDESLRDLLKNYKSNFAKGEVFSINYKSKKCYTESLSVLNKHWNNKNSIYTKLFTGSLKAEQKLPNVLKRDCRLKKTKLNEYFICIPKLLTLRNKETNVCENQVNNVISLDPGVRTFQTGYDPNGYIHNIGTNNIGMLSRLLHYKHKIQSKITKTTGHSSRRNLKKAMLRISRRIKNLVLDCHKKVALWLCKNYNTIITPRMNFHNFKKMSKRNREKMVTWNHCGFVDRLNDKSREFLHCKVIEVTEEFTSKTCGCCGEINETLGGSKTFQCAKCFSILDRDANGSRNIMLKYATECPKNRVI